jgi:hypothetical protein
MIFCKEERNQKFELLDRIIYFSVEQNDSVGQRTDIKAVCPFEVPGLPSFTSLHVCGIKLC